MTNNLIHLTGDAFFLTGVLVGLAVIVGFLLQKRKILTGGDIVPVLIIFIGCMSFINSCRTWYVVLTGQDIGVLKDQKFSILAGSLAIMWVAALAIIRNFQK